MGVPEYPDGRGSRYSSTKVVSIWARWSLPE
jgi:hypothetical protein